MRQLFITRLKINCILYVASTNIFIPKGPKTPLLLAQLAVTLRRLPLMSQIDTDNLSISVFTPAGKILYSSIYVSIKCKKASNEEHTYFRHCVLITIMFMSHMGYSLSKRSIHVTQAHLHISGALLCDLQSLKAKYEAGG